MPIQEDPWIPRDVHVSCSRHERTANNSRVRINVSGLVFETYESTLATFPHTLLGSPAKRAAYYDKARQEYYFDRNRKAFDSILFFYQSGGKLVPPEDLSQAIFLEEMSFFGLNTVTTKRTKEAQEASRRYDSREENTRYMVENSWLHFQAEATMFISQLISDPSAARLLGCWGVLATVAFVSTVCFKTLPQFQKTDLACSSSNSSQSVCLGQADRDEVGHFVWSLFEKLCVSWFALEFLARLVHASKTTAYLFSWLALIDFLSFFPPCVIMLIQLTETTVFPRALRDVVQFLPFLSIIKLTRYSLGLRLFWTTLRSNTRELALLCYCLVINLIAFTGLIYYCEYEENKFFASIPASFWYTVVTMTTVGYGDVTPVTFGGKIFGALCAILGVTYVLAIPTTVIASNFNLSYQAHVESKQKESMNDRVEEVRRPGTNIPKRYRWTTHYRSVGLSPSAH